MEKEKFIPYLKLCRHYLDYVDSLSNSDPKDDFVSITIYQRELAGAALHLMKFSNDLHKSIISSCVESNLFCDNK